MHFFMFAYGINCDKFKTQYQIFKLYFLEDIDIMNFIKFLLAFSLSTFIIADDGISYNKIAQSEPNDEVKPNDEENENTNLEDAVEDFSAPIDFKDEYLVTANLGTSIPFGSNLKSKFTPGANIKFNILTPFGFTFLNKDFKIAAGVDIISCKALEERSTDANGNQYTDYSATNIGAKLVTSISSINLFVGTGLATASGNEMILRDSNDDGVPTYNEYSMTSAYFSAGGSYTLPLSSLFEKIDMGNINFDISNLTISLFGEGVMIMAAPAEEGTSDIINAGISIGYPILF